MTILTFYEKYNHCQIWWEKAIVMKIYHTTMNYKKGWSLAKTAQYFGVSVGLVSENLKLANALDSPIIGPKLKEAPTRQAALEKIK